MEKNWKKITKVISNGLLYPRHIQSIQKNPICLEYWFDKDFLKIDFKYEQHEDAHIMHYRTCDLKNYYYGICCFKM